MCSPPSNALTSFPVVCLILVLAKISLYFVVKYSLGMTYFSLVFEQPANTRNAVSKINCFHWFLMFLVSIS